MNSRRSKDKEIKRFILVFTRINLENKKIIKIKMKKEKRYPFYQSTSFAFKGIFKAIKKEKNLKIHLFMGSLAVLLGLVLKISCFEWLVIVIVIVIVIAGEIFNSSLEAVCDLLRFKLNLSYYETYWIRNFSAGAVMVLALGALITGIIIFGPKIFNKV